MGNIISIVGYICNLKRFNNDDGSVRLYFSLSCQTEDPKRWENKQEKDFWNVDLFVPARRSKLVDYLQERRMIAIAGVPYKAYEEQEGGGKREWAKIRANVDMVTLIPSGNNQNQGQGQQSQNTNQSASGAPSQGDYERPHQNQTGTQGSANTGHDGRPPAGPGW